MINIILIILIRMRTSEALSDPSNVLCREARVSLSPIFQSYILQKSSVNHTFINYITLLLIN